MAKFIKATPAHTEGFWRCGVRHSTDGAVFRAAAFSNEDWERLMAEPALVITDASEAQLAALDGDSDGKDGPEELRFNVVEIIRELEAEDFQKDGKPKLDSIRALLSEGVKISAAERDEIWAELTDDGFKSPTP